MKIMISHYAIVDKEGFSRSFMIAKNIVKFGHEVVFLTSQNAGEKQTYPYRKEFRENVQILSFPDVVSNAVRKTGLGPMNLILRLRYSFEHRFDVVHSDAGHRPVSGLPCVLNRKRYGSKYISEWWEDYGKEGKFREKQWWYRLTRARYDFWACNHNKKTADGVVCLSSGLRKMARALGIPDEKLKLIRGGADTDKISFIKNTRHRRKYHMPPESLTFCYAGISETELSQDLLPFVNAVNRLKADHPISLITTGKYLSQKTKKKYRIGAELHEFGWMEYDCLSEVLSCADVFLLLQKDNASNRARWPNKTGDYLSAGRKVMANPVGDLKNFMRDHPRCFVQVDWNEASIQSAILAMLKKKKSSFICGESRRIAETQMSWKMRAEELIDFYTRTQARGLTIRN
jgi:glycosyltransferase involved in cell wall biosynthesis